MVYFVQAIDGGPIKIGHSENVDLRVRQLEGHYSRPLALLATIDGGIEEERAIHARFSHLRLGRTEQFEPAADLMAFIGRPLFASACEVEEMPVSVRSLASVKGTDEFEAWFDKVVKATRLRTRTLVLLQGLEKMAKDAGVTEPMPER